MLLKDYKDLMEEFSQGKIKITNTYLAKLLGTTSQNISKRIKNDSILTTAELSKLEETTGIYCTDETTNTKVRNYANSINNTVTVLCRPNVYLSAGYGVEICDEKAEYMTLDERLFFTDRGTKINPQNCEIVAVSGNSMAPEYRHGDRVIIDKSVTDFIDGHIFAFRYNGECFIKEINLLGKRVKAVPLNKEYDSFYIEPDEDVKIFGRIIPRVRL